MDLFAKNQPFRFGENYYSKGGRYGPLNRKYLDLIIVYKGTVKIYVDGQERNVPEGQAALVYNEHSVDYHFPRDQEVHLSWCQTGELTAEPDALDKFKSLPHSLVASARLRRFQREGVELGHGDSAYLIDIRSLLGQTVVREYLHLANIIEEEKPLPAPVLKTKRYIDQHYCEEFGPSVLEAISSLNREHLARLFKKHLDCTPSKYLWRLRSEKAIHLLYSTGLSVAEIAEQSGFKNPYHFSRYIKEHYGYNPKTLRLRKWAIEPGEVIEGTEFE